MPLPVRAGNRQARGEVKDIMPSSLDLDHPAAAAKPATAVSEEEAPEGVGGTPIAQPRAIVNRRQLTARLWQPFRDGLPRPQQRADRKSVVSGKRVSVRVGLGGLRIITKKKQNN